MGDSLRLISLLIGQNAYEDLLIRMPGTYFSLMPETKEWVWDELLGLVNQGIEDPAELAKAAEGLLTAEVPDEYSKEMSDKLIREHGDEEVHEVHL